MPVLTFQFLSCTGLGMWTITASLRRKGGWRTSARLTQCVTCIKIPLQMVSFSVLIQELDASWIHSSCTRLFYANTVGEESIPSKYSVV